MIEDLTTNANVEAIILSRQLWADAYSKKLKNSNDFCCIKLYNYLIKKIINYSNCFYFKFF